MEPKLTLDRAESMLLVIDVQTRLLPVIRYHERVVEATANLLEAAEIFDLPVVASVQYVKGLGDTHEKLASIMQRRKIEPLEKATFSLCRDETIRKAIEEKSKRQVIVAGIECHVCVMQTVMDLLGMGLQPFVCIDAVSSRYKPDRKASLQRMADAGAVLAPMESVLFELCNESGTDQFKKILGLVKGFDEVRD